MKIALGVDGGTTKTVVLVSDLEGTILASGSSGSADIYRTPTPEHAVRAVEEAVMPTLYKTGVQVDQVGGAAFSLTGVEWPEDYSYWRSALQRRGFGEETRIVHQTVGALRGGSPDGTGVVVISSSERTSVGSRSDRGEQWNSGHWQESLGLQQLADLALRAVYRAEVGIEPATVLKTRVLEHFRVPSVEELLHVFTGRTQKKRPDILPLARILIDAAGRGDATALRLIDSHGADLGDYALAAARRVGILWSPFYLVLHGSLFAQTSRVLNQAVLKRIGEIAPDVRQVGARFEPAVGALILALERAGVTIDERILERLAMSVPHRALFAS